VSVFRLAPRPPRRRFALGGPRAPIAWWKFDESTGALTAVDSTNNHFDGDIVGSPTFVAGRLDNALSLSGAGGGAGQFVSFGVHNEFLAVSTPRTYTGWIKFGTLTGQHAILSNIEGSGDFQGFLIEQNNAQLRVYCDSGTPQLTVSGFVANTTDWVHFAVVLDGGVIRVYRNGSRIGSDGAYTSVSVASPTPQALTLGRQTGITTRDLNGAVDDFRIYDFALSDAQVAALAELPAGTTVGVIQRLSSAARAPGSSRRPETSRL
jgi:Concanavalin A-like lectin/glucanases superfamily